MKYQRSNAKKPYRLKDGTPVPGVTTILSCVNKPALLAWAHKMGMEGKDYRKVSGNAADIGSIAHFMVETFLKNQTPDLSEFPPADVSKAESSFIKFLEFWDKEKLKLEHSEIEIISEGDGYGGKIDIIARDEKGRLCLIDIKTSKAIYQTEYFAQVAAYANLWNHSEAQNQFGAQELITRHLIVRIGKTEAMDLEIQEKTDLTKYWKLFYAALQLYKAQKEIEA